MKQKEKIIYSKKLMISLMMIIFLISLLSLYLFFFRDQKIQNMSYSDWQEKAHSWVIYLWFSAAIICAFSGVLGDLYLHRNKLICFLFYFIFLFFYLINSIILHLWFETIEELFVGLFLIIAYSNWKKGTNAKNVKIKLLKIKTTVLLFLFLLIITFCFGFLTNFFLSETKFYDSAPYLDFFIAASFLIGWGLMSKKYLNSYFFFVLSTIAGAVLFALIGAWIYLTSNLIYLGLYYLGINNWKELYHLNEL